MKIINLIAVLFFLLQGCGGKKLTQNDIIGTWKGSDTASFIFKGDKTFTGKSLPAEYFTFSTSKEWATEKKINGTGTWSLEKGQELKIKLHFQEIDNVDINGFYELLIAGENGLLDNKPPWYLFEWKEEEGGERYKFKKIK